MKRTNKKFEKVTDLSLKESEVRYRRLFEAAQDGILILDAETGMIEDVNPYLINVLGYSREEFIKKKLWEVGAFKDIEASQEAFEALQDNEYIRYENLPLKTKDGQLIQVEFVSNVYLVGNEKVIQCNILDITARKQAEAGLRESDARFRNTLESMIEGCQIIGYDWRYLFINDSAVIQGKLNRDELLGHTMMECYPGIENTDMFAMLRRCMDERTAHIMVNEFIYPDGSKGWFELSIQPTPNGIFILSRDITERMQVEGALSESEERYRFLFENNPNPMWVYDVKTLAFLAVNGSAVEKYGYTREEFLHMTIADIRPKEDISRLMDSVTRQRPTLQHAGEWRHRLKDGTIIYVEVTSHTLRMDNHDSAFVMAHDITERKLGEEALRHSQEETTHANHLLLALSHAAQAVQRARTTEEVYSAIQEQVTKIGYSASGFELSEDGRNLRIAYLSYGADLVHKAEKLIGLSPLNFHFHPRVDSVYQKVIDKGETVFVKNAAQAVADTIPKKLRTLAGPLANMFKLGQSIFTPLKVGDKTIGLMAFTGPGLTEADNPAVTAFASQAAIAIQNARLYEQAQQEISERKQAEQALRESETRFRSLYENTTIGLYRTTPDGQIPMANPALLRMLGYKSFEELSNRDLTSGVYEPDYPRQEFQKRMEQDGDVRDLESAWKRKDGSIIYVRESAHMTRNENNQPLYYEGTVEDITKRKQAEQEIINLAKFPSENPNPVLRLSRDGNVLYANEASGLLMELWGCTAGDPAPFFLCELATQALVSKENKIVDIDCDEKIYSIIVAPVPEADYVNLYGRDVTDARRAEEAMRESDKRFRSLYENSPVPIWEEDFSQVKIYLDSLNDVYGTDLETYLIDNPDSISLCASLVKIIDVNQASMKLFGANDKTALLENLPKTFTPETFDTFRQELIAICKGEHRLEIDGEVQTLAGQRRDITLIWAVVPGYEKSYSKVLVSLFDITERKQAVEQIKISNDELTMLFELSHSLAQADNLEDILELVNRHAVESVHTTFARIALLEGDNYILRAAYPIRPFEHDLGIGERNPVSSLPCTQRVLEQKEPMILRDSDQGISNEEKKALHLGFAQSVCLIPLRISDSSPTSVNLIGLLMLGEARNERREPFTPQKMRLAQTIGDSAAIAIRRMLLREQTERRLQQLVALSEIDLAIISSSDMVFSLGVLLLQVLEQLKVDAADIWRFDPASQALEFVSGRGFRTLAFENAKPLQLGEGNAGRAALELRTIHVPDLTAQIDNPRLTKALEGEFFKGYYAVPLIVMGQVKGVLELFHRSELEPNEEWLKFLQTLANQAAIAIDNSSLFKDLQDSNIELIQAYDATIQGWSQALDLRDSETEGHTQRVTELTTKLGRLFGLSEDDLVHVRWGALLHDIGKMGVPDGILLKPGPLTDEEWVVMRKHTTFAFELLLPIHFLGSSVDIPYCHHEKWDGTGYPRGLSGDQIPFAARIFALVDIYDALTSDRPYRKAWPEEKVLDYIRSLSGTHLDPQVVKICLEPGLLKGQSKKRIQVEPVQWSEKFSVGVSALDQQHQQLIKLLNRMISTQGTISTHSETVSEILMEMTRYAQTHFRTEERLMEAYGYPGLEKQKEQHHDFRKKTVSFSTATTVGVDQVPEALLDYLEDWLIHHILEEDMAYRSFFKDKGVD